MFTCEVGRKPVPEDSVVKIDFRLDGVAEAVLGLGNVQGREGGRDQDPYGRFDEVNPGTPSVERVNDSPMNSVI